MAVRTIEVREKVMETNNRIAAEVRERLSRARVPAFNLVSSPGAGKTLLLERTLEALGSELTVAVVAGAPTWPRPEAKTPPNSRPRWLQCPTGYGSSSAPSGHFPTPLGLSIFVNLLSN